MDELFPAAIVAIIWLVISIASSVSKSKKKNGQQPKAPAHGRPVADRVDAPAPPAPAPAPAPTISPLRPLEGEDPCHADQMRSMPSARAYPADGLSGHPASGSLGGGTASGSLGGGTASGSLGGNTAFGSLGDIHTEGFDPCHDELYRSSFSAENGASGEAPSGAPFGSFSGDDIVRGFIWGEILRRRGA